MRHHANTLVYYFTSEIRTTSLQRTKLLAPKCPLFGGSTVFGVPSFSVTQGRVKENQRRKIGVIHTFLLAVYKPVHRNEFTLEWKLLPVVRLYVMRDVHNITYLSNEDTVGDAERSNKGQTQGTHQWRRQEYPSV